jgi:hypothetical protein
MRLNGAFGNIFDPASLVLSQSFYYGQAEDNGAPDHKAIVVDGRFVDLCDDLASFEESQPQPTPPPVNEPASANPAKQTRFEHHLSRIGDGEKSKYDGFNDPLIRATGAYASQHGVDLDRVALKEELKKVIREAPKKPERPDSSVSPVMRLRRRVNV